MDHADRSPDHTSRDRQICPPSAALEGECKGQQHWHRHQDSAREPEPTRDSERRHDQERPFSTSEVLRSLHVHTLRLARCRYPTVIRSGSYARAAFRTAVST